jgi:4-amino-4-deoxy-L-arabinose transferase-like glycosyltransferase
MSKFLLGWKMLLIGIVLLAGILRFWQLGDFPAGFHNDEAAWGYNAYSILKTGADEYGVRFPIILESFGEYKGVIYTYLALPFVYFFDLTPFAVRIPSVIFSLGSLLVLFFITKEIVKRTNIALLTAFLFAVSPWSINLSRVAADFNIAFFFFLLLAYSLLQLKKNVSFSWGAVGAISGILAIFSYTAARFYVVILVFIFLIASLALKQKKIILNKSYLALLALLIISGIIYSSFATTARFSQVSIFSTAETKLVLEEQIREDQFEHALKTRILHNKVVNYGRTILNNYGQYFTFDFLFLSGGLPFREKIPNVGLFYIWQLPFLLFGIYFLARKKSFSTYLLFSWVLLLIIPSVITFDEIPNVHRSLVILPPLLILVALGIITCFEHIRLKNNKIYLIAVLLFVGLFEFVYFQDQYFIHFNKHQSWHRGYAYKPLVESLEKLSPNYKKIVMIKSYGGAYISLLFFGKYDPATYQAEGSPLDRDFTGFGKYYFIPQDCPLNGGRDGKDQVTGEEGILYVNKGDCVTPINNVRVVDTIYWQDNSPAFKLLEYVPSKN